MNMNQKDLSEILLFTTIHLDFRWLCKTSDEPW